MSDRVPSRLERACNAYCDRLMDLQCNPKNSVNDPP